MKNRLHIIISITACLIITLMLSAASFADKNEFAAEGIEIIDIQKENFRGKLMIIQDPSRVFLGTVPEFGETQGMTVLDVIDLYKENNIFAAGGINGGAFTDQGNISYTGQPVGIVVSEGDILFMEENESDRILYMVGFTEENQMFINEAAVDQVSDMSIRNAVCVDPVTSPFLIRDGEVLEEGFPEESDFGGGRNSRTAIGQRDDGAVLFLVIDGRQADSLGATVSETAECMQEYGAVNAALMTGGTSSQMVYEEELLNTTYSPMGPRKGPTAWLIRE